MLIQASLACFFTATLGSAQTIDQLFTVDPSCNLNTMNTILNDARTMLDSAQSSISDLMGAKRPNKAATRNQMRNAANSFGTTYYKPAVITGLNSADKATLSTVGNNLGYIQTLLTGGVALGQQLSPKSAYLACADSAYKRTSSANDVDSNLKPGTSTSSAYGMSSVFYAPAGPVVNGVNKAALRPGPNQNSVCSAIDNNMIVEAETFTPDGNPTNQPYTQLVLCDRLFNGQPDSRNVVWQTTISPNPGPAPNDFKRLWKFTAGILIHEMFHILGKTQYVDRIFDDPNGGFRPYGPQNILNIAENADGMVTARSGDVTTTNLPDAYRMFCEESQFGGTEWDVSGAGG